MQPRDRLASQAPSIEGVVTAAATRTPKPRTKRAVGARSKRSAPAQPRQVKGWIISVHGPFGTRALVELATDDAIALVGKGEIDPAPAFTIDAVRQELEHLEDKLPGISSSPVSAAALAMAYEVSSPATSATAKSMCAARLMEAVDRLRALVPAEPAKDRLDELQRRREVRRAKTAKAAAT